MENQKRRVALSVTGSLLDEFRAVSKKMGFPSSIMSTICEEAIKKTCEVFKKAQNKGGLSMVDLFQMIGEEMEAIENEKPAQKTTRVEKKPRR